MILGHTIALDPTPRQAAYLRRACGTARYAYNWGLAEWPRVHEAGDTPSMAVIKCRWNAHRKADLPWTYAFTDGNAAINLRKLGTAGAELTRGDMAPLRYAQAYRQVPWLNRNRN